MKKLVFLLISLLLCTGAMAQKDNDDENVKEDISKYLAGAVPEVNGKVVFSYEISLPSLSKKQIYDKMLQWTENRMKKNKNISRVIYKDAEKGIIAALGEEYIVFRSSALSLDRTIADYQLTENISDGKCSLSLEKIKYMYDKEKYTAEEWITDKVALNKSKTKLVVGLAKFRKKTVDFAENLFEEAENALNTSVVAQTKTTPKRIGTSKTITSNTTTPMKQINAATIIPPEQKTEKEIVTKNAVVSPITGKPLQTKNAMEITAKFDHFNVNVTNLERSIAFYGKALGLKEVRRKVADDGSYILAYLSDNASNFLLELTWLRDHKQAYELGENESHLCFRVAGNYEAVRAFHKEMNCVCFENTQMGLYFINDPDGYWIEILPQKK